MGFITKALIGLGISIGGWELFKWVQTQTHVITLQQGHIYALMMNYTSDPPAPVTPSQVQQQLDLQAPGQFTVMSANMVPGATSAIRQMAILVYRLGPTEVIPSTVFTLGWPSSFGTVTLVSEGDLGPGSAPAAAVASTVNTVAAQ